MNRQEILVESLRLASTSPDPSTQNAAILMNDWGGKICAVNAPPHRVEMNESRWTRPAKYHFIEHAERAVIFEAARRGIMTNGATLVCPWFACADCARAIILAGITEVVGLVRPLDQTNERWNDSCLAGDVMLAEAGVQCTYLSPPPSIGITVRRNGVEVAYGSQ